MTLTAVRRSAVAIAVVAAAVLVMLAFRRPAPVAVEVGIDNSRFDPVHITVDRGTTVTFTIRNDDPLDHEFILGDLAVQLAHERGSDTHHDGTDGAVSVAAGETATVTYTFAQAGEVLFGCHLPGHWDYGMRGTVRVV